MNKIIRRTDARMLAEKMVNDGITVQLWDSVEDNRLLRCKGSTGYNQQYQMIVTDTVNGTEYHENMSIYTIAEALWNARKFINHSGQLETI